jgi:chromate transporter
MVNISFFAGGILRGFRGSMIALLGILLPSFIIMLVLASLLVSFPQLALEDIAVRGLRPAVIGVLAALVLRMSFENIKSRTGYLLVLISAGLMFFLRIPPYIIIITALTAGIIYWIYDEKRKSPSSEKLKCITEREIPSCSFEEVNDQEQRPLEDSPGENGGEDK